MTWPCFTPQNPLLTDPLDTPCDGGFDWTQMKCGSLTTPSGHMAQFQDHMSSCGTEPISGAVTYRM